MMMYKILDLVNGEYISIASVFCNEYLSPNHILCYSEKSARDFVSNNIRLWGRKIHEFEPIEVKDKYNV